MEHTKRFETSRMDEERYRLLVESVIDYAIYMLDPDGVVVSWNAGARRFKGYEANEIIGRHFSQFYTDEDRQAGVPVRALETATREGKFESEGWRVRKDGTRFWAEVVIDPIRTESGELIGFAKITHDVSDRKAAEETLRQSQEQFRLLVQGVTDYAIYMLDPMGRVSSWNVGAQRIKGYLAGEIIGEHFSRFYTSEDRTRGDPQKALETARAEGRFEKEGWRVRKDGTRFWANVVIDAIRSEDGTLIGFAKVTRDITLQREARAALEEARETLFQSQKMDAIGQLTGGIAHDFNNLLMAIQGSLELLRKRLPGDPKAALLLENAKRAAQRGAVLTQRMLSFARRQELNPEPIEIASLVRGMTDLLERSLGSTIRIRTRFPPTLQPVLADPNQLELALLNLAVNARDAMPDGGSILIAGQEEFVADGDDGGLKPGSYVRLAVIDTGKGMDEATLALALDPFFTTKGVGKGTGLGLPMVLGMAQQSEGRLVLKSRKGEGTTAEIWLPVASGGTRAARNSRQPGVQPAQSLTHPMSVLAVDDDSLVLLNTAAMLEDLGHTVFEAASGQQALDILRKEKTIDLVITDQGMPNMTGSQLAAAIAAEWPHVPIILATGYAELPSGANQNLPKLSKPFDQKALAEAIATVTEAKDVVHTRLVPRAG
jgi:PAS domain S-box-containing protein